MAHLPPPTTDLSPALAGQLQTDFVSFSNRAGLRVAACLDHAGAGWAAAPWVVVAPKYGETKKNNLQLAYQLAANGLNVPSVIIFGGSHTPANSGYTENINLYTELPCSGCWLSGHPGSECPHDLACMTAIAPATVLAAVDEIMARPKPSHSVGA